MDCPNCGTWNPDDKNVCWRCQTELPKPQPKKERRQLKIFGMPAWLLIIIALFVLMPWVWQCSGGMLGG
ncbi:MAG: DUF2116 family Zn-ribbon domain-containing protein [Caldilineales bacterium]|nr:DUF2116 family Zn-ribbon domain-containing protein [Caldilineales bacterium]